MYIKSSEHVPGSELAGQIELVQYKTCQSNLPTLSTTFDLTNKNVSHLPRSAPVIAEAALEASNVFFKYNQRDDWVLKGLSIHVPKGGIYGLLGPSGCGKSTLLRLMVGSLLMQNGSLQVLGFPPGKKHPCIPGAGVGYMPQELSLYDDLSANELLTYFGRLYRISDHVLKRRVLALCTLLDLSDHMHKPVGILSGGEQRRVSFCIALLHQPPLVILDEPTVGVDPLLRSRIWSHLHTLTEKTGATVMITTHYVEEARQAAYVGLMRGGFLLDEAPPESLMATYNVQSLEAVFLKLCTVINSRTSDTVFTRLKQLVDNRTRKLLSAMHEPENSSLNDNKIHLYSDVHFEGQVNTAFDEPQTNFHQILSTVPTFPVNNGWSENIWQWAFPVASILRKNLMRNARHPLLLAFQFLLPISQMILFCICVGGEPFHTPVIVVNHDQGEDALGALFLEHVDPYYVKLSYGQKLSAALAEVRTGRVWGVMHIKEGFSDVLLERIARNESLTTAQVSIGGVISVHADLTNRLQVISAERSLWRSMGNFLRELADREHERPQLASGPVRIPEVIYGQVEHPSHAGYRVYFAPGFALSVTFGLSYGLTCVLLMLERDQRMFERHLLAGVRSSQILTAHALTRMLMMGAQALGLMTLLICVFEWHERANYALACLLIMLVSICGLALGLLISAVCKQVNTAAIFGVGLLFYVFFMSGVAWPIQAQPLWLRPFAKVQPTTLANEALRSVLMRGWGITHQAIWTAILIICAWTSLFFYAGNRWFRYF